MQCRHRFNDKTFIPPQGKRAAFLILFYLLLGYYSNSQSIRTLSTQDGLPQSFVSGLVQDKDGFIWIGTRNGLARYDGIQYKVFLHKFRDTASIASNVIIWMNRDLNNHLWIEYESGDIDEMDPVTEQIFHVVNRTRGSGQSLKFVRRGWIADSHGIFWGIRKGTGLNSYNKATRKVEQYNKISHQFTSDTLRGITEDSSRKIWVLGQTALSVFDRASNKFVHIPIPYTQDYNNHFDSDEEVVDLHCRSNGQLMWGDRKRLFFFNPLDKSFRVVPLLIYPYAGIRWIRSGPDSLEYFESNGDVFRYDDFNGLSRIGTAGMNNPHDARSFLADHSGILWVGTNAGGVHQLDLVTPFFESFSYQQGFPTDLLRKEFGLSMSTLFNWKKEDENFSASGYHFRSVYDQRMRVWMGLKETVCYYDFLKKSYVKLPPVPIAESEQGIGIKGLTISKSGIPLVAGYDGSIFLYDSVSNSWKPFIDPQLIRKSFGISILPQDIHIDDERVWMSTAKDGLLYIDIRSKQIKQLKEDFNAGSLPTNQLLGFLEDPQKPGLLWIGSYQGLICLDKKTLKCKVYSLEEGLPDNTIYSVQIDRSGNLWLSTNKGLCRFDPETNRIRVFRASYGLPGDEFNRFHHFKLPDGRLAFGGTEGWTVFDPQSIKNDEYDPPVSLTFLKVNNSVINPANGNPILSAPLNSIKELVLPASDNTIAIGFAGLQFNQPQDLHYRYQLKDYDEDWIQAGNLPIANYTKIPPGKYVLMVNASNTNGKWSNQIKSLIIKIRPPWWLTWWAYLCYGILLVVLTWGYINFRVKRGLLKQEMSLKEREARQLKDLDEIKTRFFSNITHEFRTPLTLILGPAEQLQKKLPEDTQQHKLTDTIMRNTRQLLRLINQLMDLAKLEAKALAPAERIGNPAETVLSVIESFETEALAKNIRIVPDMEAVQQDYWFPPEVLERIIYNLVSNALKYTPAKGEIKISLNPHKEGLKLILADNGIGIPAKKLPFVFDRFYQAHTDSPEKDQPSRVGTGIGLALVKELVELMGGKIRVQSKAADDGETNTGTSFFIYLPFRVADDELVEAGQEITNGTTAHTDDATETKPAILLAEDNTELAAFISDSLRSAYSVHHFSNGALALENAVNLMPDIIISDVLMPVMDGFTLTARLKEDIRTSHIPVILLTAKASQESRIEGLTLGANDYLTKPFHPTELLLRIHNLLEQQAKLREYTRRELAPESKPVQVSEPVSQDLFLSKLYSLIDDHLDDPLFGVEEVVLKMEMSRTSLHRKIKSVSGMSTNEIIRNYRLKRASGFLLEGHNSTDTAYMSGFGSPAYFTKCFREMYNMTPGDFIRQHQQAG